ncbi:MAG: hypothetical protein AB7O48_14035 [Cyclobacteriaceae bacterium]
MTDNIRVRLLSQLKKKDSDSWIQRILKGGLTLLIYPLIFIFGLLVMLFGFIISIFQKQDTIDTHGGSVSDEPWTIWTEIGGVRIWKKYKGDIRFGPSYFEIKTEPTIDGFEDKIFGDWHYRHGQGIFLQQWNNTENPNTTLIYLDIGERKVKSIKDSINSVLWDIVERVDKKLELNCDTGDRILKYEVEV